MEQIEPINKIEKELGLPEGFYNNLLKEDDWSFIIKLHSLIEASVTHLLTETLGIALKDYATDFINKENIGKNFAWLELSGKKVGKVSLANSFGLILEEQKKFIYSLSEIRNLLVHKVSNVNFSFENYVNKLDRNQKKNFFIAHSFGLISQAFTSKERRETFMIKETKRTIWLNGIYCLKEIYYCIQTFNMKKKIEIKRGEDYRELLDSILKAKNS